MGFNKYSIALSVHKFQRHVLNMNWRYDKMELWVPVGVLWKTKD